jgi:hypothetical protein
VPIAVEHDERRRWIIATASGLLTLPDVVTLIQTARSSVEYRMWPMLVDAQMATTDMTEADVERAVEAVRHAARVGGPRAHVALVAHDDIVYARMLQYEMGCADIGVQVVRVFRQRPDAEHWLALLSGARNFR